MTFSPFHRASSPEQAKNLCSRCPTTAPSLFLREAKTWKLLGNPNVTIYNNNPADSQVKDGTFLRMLHFRLNYFSVFATSAPFSAGCLFRSGQSFRRVLQRPGHRAQWHHRWPGTPSADTKVQEIFDPGPGTPVRFFKISSVAKSCSLCIK